MMRRHRLPLSLLVALTLVGVGAACDDDDAGPSFQTPPSGIEGPDDPGRAGDQDDEPAPLDEEGGSGPGGGTIGDADPDGP